VVRVCVGKGPFGGHVRASSARPPTILFGQKGIIILRSCPPCQRRHRLAIVPGETKDECGRQTGDYRRDEEALVAIRAVKAAADAAATALVAAVPAVTPKVTPTKAPVPVKKGGLTEAGRKALSIAMKKRWAAKKKAAKGKAA
jgi:hypothetical protein